jgi:hypothetical protein
MAAKERDNKMGSLTSTARGRNKEFSHEYFQHINLNKNKKVGSIERTADTDLNSEETLKKEGYLISDFEGAHLAMPKYSDKYGNNINIGGLKQEIKGMASSTL